MAPLSPTAQALLERISFLGHAPVPDGLLDIHTPDAPPEDLRGAMAELTARGFVSPAPGGHFLRPDNFAPLGREAGRTSRQHMIDALRWLDRAFDRDPRDPAHWPWLEPLMRHALFVSARAGAAGVMVPTIRLMNELALLHDAKGLLADAEMIYRRALTLNEAHAGPDDPAVAVSLSNLAGLLYRTGDLAEVEALFRRALAISTAKLPPGPALALAQGNLGAVLRATGRRDEAELLFRRAVAMDAAFPGRDPAGAAARLGNLGNLLIDAGNDAEAEPLLRQALTLEEGFPGPASLVAARTLNNLAGVRERARDTAGAEALYRRCLAINEAAFGPDHLALVRPLGNFAGLLHTAGRFGEAEPLYRRALAIEERAHGPEHAGVANCLNNLADLLRDTNRLEDARALLHRAMVILTRQQHRAGQPPPALPVIAENHRQVLRKMGLDPARIEAVMEAIGRESQ